MPECRGAPIASRPACAIARLITVSCANEPPAPPYSSGMLAQRSPAWPSLSQAERSMMPSPVHFSTCGTSSPARKRFACSSSSTRSSLIHAGRGTCRDSIDASSVSLSAALIVDHLRGFVFGHPFVSALRRQVLNAIEPCGLALDADLPGGRHCFRIVQRVDGHADAAGAVGRIGQRRAAVLAETALGNV